MRCPNCNTENEPNAIFCRSCSAWILSAVYIEDTPPSASESEAPKKPVPRKRSWRIPVIAGVLAIATLCTLLLWPKQPQLTPEPGGVVQLPPVKYPTPTAEPATSPSQAPYVQSVSFLSPQYAADRLVFIADDTLLKTELSGTDSLPAQFATSMDGSAAAYLTQTGQMLYVQKDGAALVADNAESFALSVSGQGLAYLTTDGGLYLYQPAGGASVPIKVETLSSAQITSYCISPNGKYVAYTAKPILTSYYASSLCCGSAEGTAALCPVDSQALLSVSNDGQLFYLTDSRNTLYAMQASDSTSFAALTTLGGFADTHMPFLLNTDHTQLLYHSPTGTHLSIGGSQAQTVINGLLLPVYPELSGGFSHQMARTYPHETLLGHVYALEQRLLSEDAAGSESQAFYSLHYLDSNCTLTLLTGACAAFRIDVTGQHLYYTDTDQNLAYIDLLRCAKGLPVQNIPIASNASDFSLPAIGSRVCYVSNNTLYVSDGSAGAERREIAAGPFTQLFCTRDGAVYYLKNGSLYRYTYTGSHALIMEAVPTCSLSAHGVLYLTTDWYIGMLTDDGLLMVLYDNMPDYTVPALS